MSIIKWVNKNITHVRDKAGDFGIRTIMHIPIGIIMGILPLPCDKFVDLFIFYESNEDRWTNDQAWKDVSGALIGFAIGRIILVAGIIFIACIIWNKVS